MRQKQFIMFVVLKTHTSLKEKWKIKKRKQKIM